MPTLRESLQSDIAAGEADLAAKKSRLAELEGNFADVLGRDIDALKSFFHSVGAHLFPRAVTQPPAAPPPPAPIQFPPLDPPKATA